MRLRDFAAAALVVCLPIGARADWRLCLLRPACLIAGDPPVRARGIATTYWRGDGHNNGRLGCVSAARRILGHNRLHDDLPIVAMRGGVPCGGTVVIENVRTGLRMVAIRLDSGPFGCRWPDGTRTVARRCPSPGKRIAVIDLTRRVAREIGADGFDPVRLRW